MKNFGLLGAAGYVAPRHMKAIKQTNNNLSAACDPSDSVGIIDSYFPDASFFTEIERFDRHIDKLRNTTNKLDYLSVCTPNYLHDAHIRLGLRNGCDVICEKPVVINLKNLYYLENIQQETEKNIYCILQLRLHNDIIKLKNLVDTAPQDQVFDVTLDYVTPRGTWYDYSWKAKEELSGGLLANIGIHFFDMLIWVFGDPQSYAIVSRSSKAIKGTLSFQKANVSWFLSYNRSDLPHNTQNTFRSIKINGHELEFSKGFSDLHTKSYEKIIKGEGFTIEDVKQSIKLMTGIREKLTNE